MPMLVFIHIMLFFMDLLITKQSFNLNFKWKMMWLVFPTI